METFFSWEASLNLFKAYFVAKYGLFQHSYFSNIFFTICFQRIYNSKLAVPKGEIYLHTLQMKLAFILVTGRYSIV